MSQLSREGIASLSALIEADDTKQQPKEEMTFDECNRRTESEYSSAARFGAS